VTFLARQIFFGRNALFQLIFPRIVYTYFKNTIAVYILEQWNVLLLVWSMNDRGIT
jgi:hypothetical protein